MSTGSESLPPAALESKTAGPVHRAARYALPIVKLGMRRLLREKSPFQMTLSLTNRCNFRCTYCEIPLQQIDEMSTAEWLAVIDELRAGGMGRASIMGGEPLLRKDVGEIARHLKCVTLDGPEEIHDRQRHPGSYPRVIRAIEVLRQHQVPVVTMTVVTPAGIDHVDHVLEVARAHGIRAYFQLEHDKHMDVRQPISPELSQARVGRLARHLGDLKRRGLPVGNSYAALERQEAERYLITCDHCHAGSYFGYVFSDGTVSHCIFTRAQVERGNGRARGYVRAFHELGAPTGPGCSCVPTHEVNHILDFDARVLFDALNVSLRSAVRRVSHVAPE